jgi:hypothetical protein
MGGKPIVLSNVHAISRLFAFHPSVDFLLLAVLFGKVALIACSFASATRTVRTFILSLDRNKYEGKRSAKKMPA